MNTSFKLFRLFGITVFLHWSWILVAFWQLDRRGVEGSALFVAIAEYVGLFAIVLLHEFGHALSCRQVGGYANQILLWPLGGIAYVQPPPRPGAQLWSIAAGPLVNVALIPVFSILLRCPFPEPVLYIFDRLAWINIIILLFNLLPIYPLDGGQILRSLLWFAVGPVQSLKIASMIGLICAGLGLLWAVSQGQIWLSLIAAYAAYISWGSYQAARRA